MGRALGAFTGAYPRPPSGLRVGWVNFGVNFLANFRHS